MIRSPSSVLAAFVLAAIAAQPAGASGGETLTPAPALTCEREGEVWRRICDDEELRALEGDIARTWAELASRPGRPRTLETRRLGWISEMERGREAFAQNGPRPFTQDELRQELQDRLDQLAETLRQSRAMPESADFAALHDGCIGQALNGCTLATSGVVAVEDGRRLAFQVQRGWTGMAGVSAGVVLFVIDGGHLFPIGWSFEGAQFRTPELFEHDGRLHVAASGVHAGSGEHNADILFRLDPQGWREIEVETWRAALDAALPEGLNVWKGVRFDWPSMAAWSPLWRDDDANCCPQGGEAFIDLEVNDRTLALAGVRVRDRRRPSSPAE